MTREDAIRLLSGLMFNGKLKEALDMAIKALEQESKWDGLYSWLNDMRFSIAPDETTPYDERNERLAQVYVIDDIMEWMVEPQDSEKVECEAEDCVKRSDVVEMLTDIDEAVFMGEGYDYDRWRDKLDELSSVYPKSHKLNTVSEEVYTQEYSARKKAELEVYRLKRQIEALKSDKPSGKWIPHPQAHVHGRGELMCSNCRNDDGCDLYYDFCPFCGAKMEK